MGVSRKQASNLMVEVGFGERLYRKNGFAQENVSILVSLASCLIALYAACHLQFLRHQDPFLVLR